MAELGCPVCDSPLDEAGSTFRCVLCEGAWVREEALVAILEQRASTLVALPWVARVDKPRPCAECRADMQTVNLGSVALDRCAQHGVWFDANEMTELLKQVKLFKTNTDQLSEHEAHRTGLLTRLAKLFGG
jgi:Zn-finger nucleic acid-binding protein